MTLGGLVPCMGDRSGDVLELRILMHQPVASRLLLRAYSCFESLMTKLRPLRRSLL